MCSVCLEQFVSSREVKTAAEAAALPNEYVFTHGVTVRPWQRMILGIDSVGVWEYISQSR